MYKMNSLQKYTDLSVLYDIDNFIVSFNYLDNA